MNSVSPTWQGLSDSVTQTLALGQALAGHLRAGDVLALIGELGAGKTQLVRGLAQGLGAKSGAVASPTFVMVHEYETAKGRPVLVHIDAYRLRSLEDLESIGWDLSGGELRQDAVVVLEWADRLGETLVPDVLEVRLSHADQVDQRHIQITGKGSWSGRMAELIAALDPKGGAAAASPVATAARAKCPTCRGPVAADSAYAPFCSQRCKMADLARWLRGDYRISREIEQSDLDEE